MSHDVITLADHPSNKAPTATLVFSDRQRGDVVRVKDGFLAIQPGPATQTQAIAGLFLTVGAALAAIAETTRKEASTP